MLFAVLSINFTFFSLFSREEYIISSLFFCVLIIAIVSPESAPVKRMVQTAKDAGVVIDVTHGRKTRSVIFTDSDYIILSAIQPETLTGRLDAE